MGLLLLLPESARDEMMIIKVKLNAATQSRAIVRRGRGWNNKVRKMERKEIPHTPHVILKIMYRTLLVVR